MNQLFVLRYRELDNPIACIENIFNALYGYELDPNLAAVASVNLKLKALMLLAKVQQVSTVDCIDVLEMRLSSQESNKECHVHSTKDIEEMCSLSSKKTTQ